MMKRLKPFDYFEPASLSEAIEIMVERGHGAYPLAGGTDLLVRMKTGEIAPSALVNLKRIQGMDQIRNEPGRGTHVGALVSISQIEHEPCLFSTHPVIQEAAGVLGSPSIRTMATLGGNIGRASPASDMAPALIVLGARVIIEGPGGKMERGAEDIFSGPGELRIGTGELISSFFLPEMPPRSGAAYLKIGRRAGVDCALVGVAVRLTLGKKEKEATDCRIALASVGPVPLRATRAEEVLLSGRLTEEHIKEAAMVASEEANPIDDLRASAWYRSEMIKVLSSRALQKTLTLAEGGKQG
jgi:CO/xanthine dehydrogenase FAD-binding subunit